MLGNYEVAAVQQSIVQGNQLYFTCIIQCASIWYCNCTLTTPLHLQQQHNNSGCLRTITLCSVQRCHCHLLIFAILLYFLNTQKMPVTEYITVVMVGKPLFVKSKKKKIAFVFLHYFLAWFANLPVDDKMAIWKYFVELVELSVCGFNLANFVMKIMNIKSKQGWNCN